MKIRWRHYFVIMPVVSMLSACEGGGLSGIPYIPVSYDTGTIPDSSAISGPVPDTGQTQCYYDAINDGFYLPTAYNFCLEPGSSWGPDGQDGYYTINPMSYTDNGDGTVLDNITGLTWQKCTLGESGTDCSIGGDNTYTWGDAITACANLNLAGSGWRLPTAIELGQLVDFSKSFSIDTSVFSVTGNPYWSSSTHADQDWAWYVNYINSGITWAMNKDRLYSARCVRGQG